ncbi:MAG: glycosyltransferase [Bacteroidota bacterium]|nr:glycosyltransferase [Bacteroidota bacterium]
MDKPKIIHISTAHRANDTRIYYKMCASLCKDYQVELVARTTPIQLQNTEIKVQFLPEFTSKFKRVYYAYTKLFIKLIRNKYRVYHFHDPELVLLAVVIAIMGRKVIIDVHEDVVLDWRDRFKTKLDIFINIYNFIIRIANSNVFFVMAEYSYLFNYKDLKNSPVVIHNFVKIDLIQENIQPKDSNRDALLLVGYLAGGRGLEQCLEIIRHFLTKGIDLNLIVVGEITDEVERIKSECSFYNKISSRIIWRGLLPVNLAYVDANRCIAGMALLSDLPNHKASYPTKIFEYMAAGLPVISSNFALYKKVVEDNKVGFCHNPNDIQAIVVSISSLLQSQNFVKELGDNGKELINSKYNWNTESTKLLNLYQLILSK